MRAIALLREAPDFRKLWLGNLISLGGDWIGWVAVSVLALHSDNSVLQLAWVFLAHHLPSALLAPIGGSLADRFDRRTILIVVAIIQCILTLGMAAGASIENVYLVQILLACRSAALAFMAPTERAAVPRLVSAKWLLYANAFDSATWSVMLALGTAAGGLLAALGATTALLIDAASFFVAMLCYARLPKIIPGEESVKSEAPTATSSKIPMSPPTLHVLQWVWQRPLILRATFAKTPMAIASGCGWILLNFTADRPDIGMQASMAIGTLYALRGIGTAIGPFIAERLSRGKYASNRTWMVFYFTGLFSILAFAHVQSWWAWAPIALLWGVGGGANWVISTAITQGEVPDLYRGRVGAFDTFGWMGLQSVAVAVAAWVIYNGMRPSTVIEIATGIATIMIVLLNVNAMRGYRSSKSESKTDGSNFAHRTDATSLTTTDP